MQNGTPRNRSKKKIEIEHLLALLMILFLIFTVLAVSITLVNSLGKTKLGDPEETGENPSGNPQKPNAIFSGGVIPAFLFSESTASLGGSINSACAILVNSRTGEVIAAKNEDQIFEPASLTKVMTLIVACENLTEEDLKSKMALTEEVAEYVKTGNYTNASTSLPVKLNGISCIGDEYEVEDLLFGIGVSSAADCSIMIASKVCPAATLLESEQLFVAKMNAKATEMGLTSTHFDNVIGHESENNYSTARELAMIMIYAMQSEKIADILGPRETYIAEAHYLKQGVPTTYNCYFSNTLFKERIDTYEKREGPFLLSTSKLLAGKTGYFYSPKRSFMACALEGKQSGDEYVLILGAALESGETPASVGTMQDIKEIADRYIK